jgi:phosphoribosylaminoimidazolecarboxamide formyltransferase/IMP cyclohydrolase
VVALNRPVGEALGEQLYQQFIEVLWARGYDERARQHLSAKPSLRLLDDRERRGWEPAERDYKRVLGGLLVQDGDWEIETRESMEVVCGELSEAQWDDLVFAWRVCKHVASNAIVIVRELRTIGIGAGQMSRVDSVRIAVEKAREHGHELAGAALASDAFFPFPDGPSVALEAGVTALIQPGGSKRDQEVVDAVQHAGAAMVFTHRRHFRH